MAIVASEIEYRYSGGAANATANACLGGAISTSGSGLVDTAVKNDLFDDVTSAEAAAGSVEYRGIYIKNTNASLTYQDARVYMSADSANTSDTIDLGIAVEAVSVTMATIANETTAPTSVTFTHPTTYAGGLQLNGSTGLATGAYRGVWVRRTIGAGAASGSITNTITAEGQTA